MVKQNDLDSTLGALADPTRRAIVQRLLESDATLSELAEPHDMSLPAVMKHVGKLVDAGLISREKKGRVVTCSLNVDPLDDAQRWLNEMLDFWNQRFDALDAYLAKQKEDDT
ncbi:MAG: metalloregulator ArsR/SmtB family transcription factor [Pseudomonadota bacterium]